MENGPARCFAFIAQTPKSATTLVMMCDCTMLTTAATRAWNLTGSWFFGARMYWTLRG
jgi:hypothetical protein